MSTIDGGSDQPYYWVDPPAEERPVASVVQPQDDDEGQESEDPELEEDAIPPDRVAALRTNTLAWMSSILRKAIRSNRQFPRELVMAYDIQEARRHPEPKQSGDKLIQ